MKTIDEIVEMLNDEFPDRVMDYDQLREFACLNGLRFDCGETRFCLFHSKWDRVLKIPYFQNVEDDYSELEVHYYRLAKTYGLEQIFLETDVLRVLDSGCPIYWQVKFTSSQCQIDYYLERNLNKKNEKFYHSPIYLRVKKTMPDDRRYADVWLFRAYQLYGKQFFKKLCVFFEENCIKDLHQNNVGWRNGKPIILDYAGYHEKSW